MLHIYYGSREKVNGLLVREHCNHINMSYPNISPCYKSGSNGKIKLNSCTTQLCLKVRQQLSAMLFFS